MAYFTYELKDLVLTIRMTGGSWGTYYRFFVRYANNPSGSFYLQDHYCPQSGTLSVSIALDPNQQYVFNAGATSNGSTSWYWSTGPSVSTGSGGGGPVDPPGPSRPNNWSWWSPIYQGAQIRISANEWNAFCARINEFRVYKGLGNYWFTAINSGTPIAAWIVNQAWSAIEPMSRYLPAQAISGGQIQASFFNGLASALNSVS